MRAKIITRRSYRPLAQPKESSEDEFAARFRDGGLTVEELLAHYATHVPVDRKL